MKHKFILIILCCLFLGCSNIRQTEQKIFVVKAPPIYNDKLSREENYYRFRHFLFPQEEIPNPIPKGLPNDDSLLFVTIEENDKITLNSQDLGSISETQFLKARLAEIFQEREKVGVYETESRKIVKAVGIEAAHSIKYGDFINVIEAIKQSGAEPIVLLFEDDARPKFKTNLSTNTEIK